MNEDGAIGRSDPHEGSYRATATERGRRRLAGIRAVQTITQRPSPTPIWPRISPPGQRVVCTLA